MAGWANGLAARLCRRRHDDRGTATVEQVGTAVVVGLVLSAILAMPLAPSLAETLRIVVCKITNGDCGTVRPIPTCLVASRDRTIGASLTAFSVKAGHDDRVAVLKYGDGTAKVIVADTYSLGGSVSAGAKLDLAAVARQLKAAGYAEGSLTATGGMQLVYKFANHADADAWVEQNRGVLDQLVNFAGGPLTDGLEQGVNWLSRTLGFDDGSARAPDAIVVEVGSQAKGGGGYGASTLAGVSAEASGQVGGSLEINLHDGSMTYLGSMEVGAKGSGDYALIGGKLGITGKASYAVGYDPDGNPISLTVTGEATRTADLGLAGKGLPIAGTGKISAGGSGLQGQRYTRSYTLDLRNPANRSAFEQAFVTAGPVALPRLSVGPGGVDPVATAGNFVPLVERIGSDAVYVQARYATAEGGGTAGVAAGEGVSFGLDGTVKSASATLQEAQSQDFGVPASRLGPLSSCGR